MSGEQTLYVVTSFFNPFGFRSRSKLYEAFAAHMRASGATLVTIEAAYGDRPFEVTFKGAPFNYQVRTDTVLFHKERLLNLAFQFLKHEAPGARYLGWFDADITFSAGDWVERTIHALQHYAVIQPFSFAVNLNAESEPLWTCPGSIYSYLNDRGYHQEPPLPVSYTYKGHPGLAWAATVEALDALGGLYDVCVAGSADTVMSNALKGDYKVYLPAPLPETLHRSMATWAERCDRAVRGNVGFARGTVLHHWHGPSELRGYEKRWSLMSFHQFDPYADIQLDSHGLYRWSGNKPRLEDDMLRSLGARNEDAI